MGGRAGLILVLGFAAIVGYISMNVNNLATKAIGNMAMYNAMTASHNLALAGANVRLAKFYQDTSDLDPLTKTFTGSRFVGSYTATMTKISWDRMRMRSISTYPLSVLTSIHDTIDVYFNIVRKNTFTIYAWMTDFEGNVFWIDKDTVWGKIHSNGNLHINGSPVFMGKATSAKNFDPPKVGSGSNKAVFKSGYETGVAPIDFPSDLSEIINASTSGGRKYIGDIYVVLSAGTSASDDGKAYIRSGNVKTGALIDSIDLGNPGFNGVIYGTGRVNVEGALDGALTICAQTDLYIQDNVTLEQNPKMGASDDILGLVADQNVVIADNAANHSNCEVQGNIFTRQGSFYAENLNSLPLTGEMQILGSVVQKTRGSVGSYSGNVLKKGFSRRYVYDDRLRDGTFKPPYYPGYYIPTYNITNWWESYRIMEFE